MKNYKVHRTVFVECEMHFFICRVGFFDLSRDDIAQIVASIILKEFCRML